jgi:fibronectin-binding autotransporter adhesin
MKSKYHTHRGLFGRHRNLIGLCTLTFTTMAANTAMAQIWDGGGLDTNWSTSDNWSTNTLPPANSALIFSGNIGTLNNNDLEAGTQFNGISFGNTNQPDSTSAFTLAGNSIKLGGNVSTTTPTGPDGTITDTIALNMELVSNSTFTVNRASNKVHHLIVSGQISGNFTLAKQGNADLTLSNPNNSFTGLTIGGAGNGNTVVNSLSNKSINSAIGAGTIINFGGGTFNYNGATTASTDRDITLGGSGGIANNGSSGANISFTGAITHTNTAAKSFSVGGNNGTANSLAGNITNSIGATSFTKNGTSTWQLTGNNTFTGNIAIDAGTLTISKLNDNTADSNLGNGTTGTIKFGFGGGGGNLNFTGNSGSTARQVIIGQFNGANGGGGATISSNGTSTGVSTDGLKFTATAFNLQENNTNIANTRKLTLSGTNTDANEISGIIQNTVTSATATPLDKSGAGRWILSGNNTYSGATALSAGVLQLNHANAIGSGNLTLGGAGAGNPGGVLGLGAGDFTRAVGTGAGQVQITTGSNGFAAYVADRAVNLGGAGATLSWVGTVGFFTSGNNTMALSHATATHTLDFQNPIDLNAFGRTFDVANGSAAVDAKLSGILSGTGASNFTKAGAGSLELTATNTYAGTTTVTAGTLIVSGSLPAGAVSVSGNLAGAGTVAGAVTVQASGSLSPGNNAVGTLRLSSSLNLVAQATGTGKLNFELGSVASSDQVTVGTTLAIGTTSLGFSDFTFSPLVGLESGTYTLMTAATSITGTLAGDVTGPIGAGPATGTLRINGKNLELVVDVPTAADPFLAWAGSASFDADANGDGVTNGLAWLLGAASPSANAIGLLPTTTQTAGGLQLTFSMLKAANRGTASLQLEHSSDLGLADPWTSVAVPSASGGPTSGVTFVVTPGTTLDTVQVTISDSQAAEGKLFGRLKGSN